jgi:hypothetical protein
MKPYVTKLIQSNDFSNNGVIVGVIPVHPTYKKHTYGLNTTVEQSGYLSDRFDDYTYYTTHASGNLS